MLEEILPVTLSIVAAPIKTVWKEATAESTTEHLITKAMVFLFLNWSAERAFQ